MVQDGILVQKVINTNLDFVATEIIPLIEKEYARVAAQEVLGRLKQTVVALTDDVAGNKAQIDLIWGSFTSDPEVTGAVRSALIEVISKIDDPKLKEGLQLLVTPIVQTLTAVTDSVKPDGAQLKQIWVSFIESPEFIAFILSNLEWLLSKVIKNEKILGIITNLIKILN